MNWFSLAAVLIGVVTPNYAEAANVEFGMIGELAKFGLLGIILGLALVALRKLNTDLTAAWQGRLEDNKLLVKVIENHNTTAQASNMAQERRNQVQEAIAKTAEQTAINLGAIKTEMSELRRVVEESKKEAEMYRADVDRKWDRFVSDCVSRVSQEIKK
jgi:L-rhamnose mutarotase